jgi:asparagine synthase (glutamine-hydrolysing)
MMVTGDFMASAMNMWRAAARRIRRHWRRRLGPPPTIVGDVIGDGLTFISEDALTELHELVGRCEAAGMSGIVVEAGCALGGSAIVLASAKAATRELRVYDVFGMIPEPSDRDGDDVHDRYELIRSGEAEGVGGRQYYGYEPDLLNRVSENFVRHGLPVEAHNVVLCKGLFEETLVLDVPVALAHIDGDWFDSVWVCLERIVPNLIPGGVIVIDDYYSWSGCRTAVDRYFAASRDHFEFRHRAQLQIRRR